jgi:ABC-type glycerol-3-phosphate transport system substrate-binding protein
VNAVARRKSALIFVLFLLLILILTPWASAPSPAVPVTPVQNKNTTAVSEPVAEEEPVFLKVAAALPESEFEFLQQQNEEEALRFPDITVELVRVDPRDAYSVFRQASRDGETADVMLVENEWVKSFAASGFLMPADNAFVGEALSEQFDALSVPLKWNDYYWAVPRDFDPYVLIWNLPVLRKILGESPGLPKDQDQWALLAAKTREGAVTGGWLALDGKDPLALLAWVQAVTGLRTDTIWSEGGNAWSGTPRGDALALLEREKAGVLYGNDSQQIAEWLASGQSVAAVLPYSEAEKLRAVRTDPESAALSADLTVWNIPHVWPRGRSFAVSSRSGVQDAARRWIAAMTDSSVQQNNFRVFGKLPVYRSLYGSDGILSSLFPARSASAFPYQPPAAFGPELPVRLARLGHMWTEWSSGKIGREEWLRRWPGLSDTL